MAINENPEGYKNEERPEITNNLPDRPLVDLNLDSKRKRVDLAIAFEDGASVDVLKIPLENLQNQVEELLKFHRTQVWREKKNPIKIGNPEPPFEKEEE